MKIITTFQNSPSNLLGDTYTGTFHLHSKHVRGSPNDRPLLIATDISKKIQKFQMSP